MISLRSFLSESTSKIKTFFSEVENVRTTPDIEELEEIYWGGVADFGDSRAASLIKHVAGYKQYRADIHKVAKKVLGREFITYRLMNRDSFEDLQDGSSIGMVSTSLSKKFAEKFKNFAGFRGKKDLILIEMKVPFDSIVMRGKPEELEVVIDSSYIDAAKIEEITR